MREQHSRQLFTIGFWLIVAVLLILIFVPDFNQLKVGILVVFLIFLIWGIYMIQLLRPPRDLTTVITQPWSLILGHLTEGVSVYDRQFKIIYLNQAFGQMVGLSPESLIHQQVTSALASNVKYRKLVSIFFPVLTADEFSVVEEKPVEIIKITIKPSETEVGEPMYLYVVTLPVVLVGTELFVKIVVDETRKVMRERETTDLLNLMAHHIRTPLNRLRWLLDTFQPSSLSVSDKEVLDDVKGVIANTMTFTDLILADLQFTIGGTKVRVESHSIADIISSIISLLGDLIKDKRLQVSIEVKEDVRTFPFDKQLVSLALYAVIENAIVYNQPDGKIIIEVKRVPQKEEVEIKISDTGIGIKPEEQEHLFDKYFRGSAAKQLKSEGLGIGLYFTRKLLSYHKGEIVAANRPEGGSTFTITLPINPEIFT